MNLPEQTKERRAELIAKAKAEEAIEDAWVKSEGIVLYRDSCKECLELRAKDERNYGGNRCFCSAAHAYEVSNIKRGRYYDSQKEKLFQAIYKIGKENGNQNLKEHPEIIEMINEIEDRFY